MCIVQLFPVLSARTSCTNHTFTSNDSGDQRTLTHDFSVSADTKEGICDTAPCALHPHSLHFVPFHLYVYICICTHIHIIYTIHRCTRSCKHPRPFFLCNLCACILYNKSTSSLYQSAVTRFAPVGMRESWWLQGGWRKSLTFDTELRA